MPMRFIKIKPMMQTNQRKKHTTNKKNNKPNIIYLFINSLINKNVNNTHNKHKDNKKSGFRFHNAAFRRLFVT